MNIDRTCHGPSPVIPGGGRCQVRRRRGGPQQRQGHGNDARRQAVADLRVRLEQLENVLEMPFAGGTGKEVQPDRARRGMPSSCRASGSARRPSSEIESDGSSRRAIRSASSTIHRA